MATVRRLGLLVRNAAKASEFLCEGLGFTRVAGGTADAPTALLSDATGGFALHRVVDAGDESKLASGYSPFIVVNVKNLDELVPRVLYMGAHLDGRIEYTPTSKVASIRGPCGHMYTLVEEDEHLAAAGGGAAGSGRMQ